MDWKQLRAEHMLAADEIYLNTGSFGSLHRRTFDDYVAGLREFESSPTMMHPVFWQRADDARQRVGPFLGAPAVDVAFTSNVTVSMSMAILGLDWEPGDEILASDREYSAIDNCFDHVEKREGAVVRRIALPERPSSPDEIVDAFAAAMTQKTRVLSVCHIYSGNGTIAPVERLAALAHEHGALIAVDGAHAPGQIPLELAASGVDLYGGNLHKWLCAPKGCGFLYATPAAQERLHHIVVGHGYSKDGPTRADDGGLLIKGRPFMWCLDQHGSRDLPSLAACATAVDVQETLGRDAIAARGREVTKYAWERLEGTGWARCETTTSPEAGLTNSLTAWHLEGLGNVSDLRSTLYERHKITIPAGRSGEGHRLRLSTHYYTQEWEIDALIDALSELRDEA